MKKQHLRFGLADDFSADRARHAAQMAARNANATRAQFRRDFVTAQPSKLAKLVDLIKAIFG